MRWETFGSLPACCAGSFAGRRGCAGTGDRAAAQTRGPAASSAGSGQDDGRPARSGKLQGDDQGSDAVRRPAAGHGSQSRGGRLDRGAAQELRLHEHRAHHVRLPAAAASIRDAPRAARARGAAGAPGRSGGTAAGQGGSRSAASARRTGVNTIPMAQPDAKLRALEHAADHAGPARGGVLHEGRHARTRTRCTSSAATWTVTAGARRRTTTARARRS